MAFSIVASFPLGTYRAHIGNGQPDPLPSPARLHAALLAAAGQGPRAQADPVAGLLMPCPADDAALRWLEKHPPDGVRLPAAEQAADPGHVRYRVTGTLPKAGGGGERAWVAKEMAKDRPESSVALGGEIAWVWSTSPPPEVSAALSGLMPDVSHLGTGESPARLRIDDAEPTHQRDLDANLWDPFDGRDFAIAAPGRTSALVDAHVTLMTRKVANAAHSGSDAIQPPPRVEDCLETARYVDVTDRDYLPAPWASTILISLREAERIDDRVRLAVAVHRALVAMIGLGAPPLVTGHFAAGVRPPANRLAIQILDPGLPSPHLKAACTIALLIPAAADPADVAVVWDAAGHIETIRGPGGWRRRVSGRPVVVDARSFWLPAQEERRWRTVVPVLADIRPPRGRGWTLDDSVTLSVALAWRERLGPEGQGLSWMLELLGAARAAGVVVHRAERLRRNDVTRFVHRVNEHAVVAPYHAELELGELVSGGELTAIGQTRHLGGGLLVPVRRPTP